MRGERDTGHPSLHAHRGKAARAHKKAAVYKLKREASSETNPASTSILAFPTPELWEDKILLSQPIYGILLW